MEVKSIMAQMQDKPHLLVCPSGRDVWWEVHEGKTSITHRNEAPDGVTHLDAFIIYRADNGCLDCVSAILECPDDPQLQTFLRIFRE